MSNLKEAISYIYDMEKNNYFVTRAIQTIDEELRRNDSVYESEVNRCNAGEPEQPEYGEYRPVSMVPFVCSGIAFGFILAITLVALHIVTSNLAFYATIVACIAIGIIIPIVINKIRSKAHTQKTDKIRNEYENKKANYDKAKKSDLKKINQNHSQISDALNWQRRHLKSRIAETNKVLNSFYNKLGIQQDFRSLIPIAYMHEFLRLGIADQLEGNGGLYDRVRTELRFDQINVKLDTLAHSINGIINNQHRLYSEIMAMNDKCDSMLSATMRQTDALLQQNSLIKNQNELMSKIQNNTQLAAYNTDRIAQEQKYRTYLERYDRW